MNKLFLIVASLILPTATVSANDCSTAIAAAKPYHDAVAAVSNVQATPVSNEEGEKGIHYDFSYTYPNGYYAQTSVIMRLGVEFKVSNGNKVIWIPASEEVRKASPKANHHVLAIVDDACNLLVIDYPIPAAKIPGI